MITTIPALAGNRIIKTLWIILVAFFVRLEVCEAQNSINVARLTNQLDPDYPASDQRLLFEVGTLYTNGTFTVNPGFGMSWALFRNSPNIANFRAGGYYLAGEIGISEIPAFNDFYKGNFTLKLVSVGILGDGSVDQDFNRYEVIIGGAQGTDLQISTPVSWALKGGGKIQITAGGVRNLASGGESGTLRLQVWTTKNKYKGGTIRGRVIGTARLGQLKGGYYYNKITSKVPYNRPPRGKYYTTMTLEEYTSSGWIIRNHVNFPKKSSFY